jgi:hypothetical protein
MRGEELLKSIPVAMESSERKQAGSLNRRFAMSAVKTFALGTIVWAIVVMPTRADPITSNEWTWTTWSRGGKVADGRALGVTTSSAPDTRAQPLVAPPGQRIDPIVPATSTMPIATLSSGARISRADAHLDMAAPPFEQERDLTLGGAQPWYLSPVVTDVFGGQPTADQQADFSRKVLERVEHTYMLNGLKPALTLDPTVPTAHTLSVVSNTSYGANREAIGISDVGGSGFSFIDKLGGAKTVDELAWAVAHNVAHELLHAWGVGEHPDKTGAYLDTATASWSLLLDPDARFSPAAIESFLAGDSELAERIEMGSAAQLLGPISPQPVPEPTTLAFWSCAAIAVVLQRRGRAD